MIGHESQQHGHTHRFIINVNYIFTLLHVHLFYVGFTVVWVQLAPSKITFWQTTVMFQSKENILHAVRKYKWSNLTLTWAHLPIGRVWPTWPFTLTHDLEHYHTKMRPEITFWPGDLDLWPWPSRSTFDLDSCDLWPWPMWPLTSNSTCKLVECDLK